MTLVIVIIVLVVIVVYLLIRHLIAIDWNKHRFLKTLIHIRGFRLLEYTVLTVDGYYLGIHRVVPSDFSSTTYNATRKPVIIAPGMYCSSIDFLYTCSSVNKRTDSDSFVYYLLNSGRYDVWLMNNRGNCFSKRHVKYKFNDWQYWRFSCDEMAKYDIRAVIDFVTNETGHNSVSYVGFSQGNLLMFAFLSEHPEYAKKIRPFIAWTPAAFFGNITSPIRHLVYTIPILRLIGGQFPLFRFSNWLGRNFRSTFLVQWVTKMLFRSTMGQTDFTLHSQLPVWLHLFPSTGSTWQYVHHLQWIQCGKFNKFDFGDKLINLSYYGQSTPPNYPLERISPELVVVLMRAVTDSMTTNIDTDHLATVLREEAKVKTLIDWTVPVKIWNHLDFIMNVKAGKLIYEKSLKYLDMFAIDDIRREKISELNNE